MPIRTMVWTYRNTTSTTTTSSNRSSDPKQNQRDLRQSGGLLALLSSLPLSCISLQLIDVRTQTQRPIRRLVCSSCVPVPSTLRATSLHSSLGGPTMSAVSRPHAKSSRAFRLMQRLFSPAWKTGKAKGPPITPFRRFGGQAPPGLQALALGRRILRQHRLAVAARYYGVTAPLSGAYRLCDRAVEAAPRVCKVSATPHTFGSQGSRPAVRGDHH